MSSTFDSLDVAREAVKATTKASATIASDGKKSVEQMKRTSKLKEYNDVYNNSSNNPMNSSPKMDIFNVFRAYVTHRTPDTGNNQPAGAIMDLSSIRLGWKYTYDTTVTAAAAAAASSSPDTTNNHSVPSRVNRFVYTLLQTPTRADLPAQIDAFDTLISKDDSSLVQAKSLLEPYRAPMIEAMLCFDNPDLCTSSTSASSRGAEREAKHEGFAIMSSEGGGGGGGVLCFALVAILFLERIFRHCILGKTKDRTRSRH